jgi:sugar phosphate isomerase/epimerase
MSGLCLKARPTPGQLVDRLRPIDGVWPDGLELYLAAADLLELDAIVRRIQECQVPEGFAWLIEGPVDSLDGADFDVTRASEADRRVVRLLGELAGRIGAKAANIHVIAPSEDIARLRLQTHDQLLERCVPFIREFVDLIREAGAVPTVENMPPVLRMRRGGFSFTPIGMASRDLLWLVDQAPGLQILPDTSHAGLYLNVRALALSGEPSPAGGAGRSGRGVSTGLEGGREREIDSAAWLGPLLDYVRQLPREAADVLGYVQAFEGHIANAQVSNAAGVLGEGLAYGDGEIDLDPVIAWLGRRASYLVTETLEATNDDAANMRQALTRMRAVLA